MNRTTAVVPWQWAGQPWVTRCACQWGPCASCDNGRHDLCRPAMRHTRQQPDTWLLDRAGRVTHPHIPIYQRGYSCQYTCPCAAAGHPIPGGLW